MSTIPVAAVTLVGSERPDVPCFSVTVADGLKRAKGSKEIVCRFNLEGRKVEGKYRSRELLFAFDGEEILTLDREDGDILHYRQIFPIPSEPKVLRASWKTFFGGPRGQGDDSGWQQMPTSHLLLRRKEKKLSPVGSVIPISMICLTSSTVPAVEIYSITLPDRPLMKAQGRWKCRFLVGGKPVDTEYGDGDIQTLLTGDRLLRLVGDQGQKLTYRQFYPAIPDPPIESVEWKTICGDERKKKEPGGTFEPMRQSFTVLHVTAKKFEPIA